jgi:HK97 family phage portal protein
VNFLNTKPIPRDDNSEPFLDALVSLTSNDSGTYVGAGALRNSDVFTAVRVIASDIASNPIKYADKRLTTMLNKHPNDNTTAWAMKFSLAATMLLNGNAFALLDRNNSGQVTSIRQIPNSQMVVTQNTSTGVITYTYTPLEGGKRSLKAADVLHFKCYTTDGAVGLSPLYALTDEMVVQKSGNKMLKGFYRSGIQGTGILKVEKSGLDAKSKATIREKFEEANSGDNALRTIVIDDTMSYQKLEVNSDVLKLVNSNDWTTRQVAKAFGLPLERLGLENDHSSSTQGNALYLQNTLTQYFAAFTSELDYKLSTGDNRFTFDTSAFFTTDPAAAQDMAIKGLQGSVRTTNEARDLIGLPPVTGGDSIMASLNYTPLDNLAAYQNKDLGSEPSE